jgi:hypothetical protein
MIVSVIFLSSIGSKLNAIKAISLPEIIFCLCNSITMITTNPGSFLKNEMKKHRILC